MCPFEIPTAENLKSEQKISAPRRIIPPTPAGWKSWEDLMQLALFEAQKAKQEGEVPIGAVVVAQDGSILGQGHNLCINYKDPSAHAEIVTLRKACAKVGNYRLGAEKAVMLVTLEPCLMCAGAMIHARLAGVVYGAPDPRAGVINSCLDVLDFPFHNHNMWHMGGILEEACSESLKSFFEERR